MGQQTQRDAEPTGDRREQIMGLAAEMFFDRGYESTTMRDLGAALGIRSASLYYYFPEKEQILFGLIESVLSQLVRGIDEVVMLESRHELRLAALVISHVVLHTVRPAETTLGDSELRSLTGERYEASLRHRHAYQDHVVRILRNGAADDRFDLIDPKLTAYSIMAQSSHVGTWFRKTGRLSLTKAAEIYAGLALRQAAAQPVAAKDVVRLVDTTTEFHRSLLHG